MSLKATFEKQGGFNLIKQYFKGGTLFTAVCEFLLLGKDKKALEILRLSTQFKTKKKLYKKYRKFIDDYAKELSKEDLEHTASDYVWVCWFQGIDNAPDLVKICYKSLKDNLKSKKIILITKENIGEYAQFPQYVMDKWNRGQITDTHMTDLLRLELLIRYGGTWIDATVLCTEKEENIPSYFFNSDLFFYQTLKPGRDGLSQYMSSWLISAKTNNRVLKLTRHLCYLYWQKNNNMVDYFLLHDFMSIALDYYKDDWDKVIPRDNSAPHMLLLRLFDKYDYEMWNAIKMQTPFHKLTYKFDDSNVNINDSYYKIVSSHN